VILEAPSLKEGTGRELRRLHDAVQQHLRSLKAMGCEAPGSFITSILELKLDSNTMFEWQRHSQESTDVPHYNELLDFINLRAQASECLPSKKPSYSKPVTSFAANASDSSPSCIVCKTEKHPLYACPRFKLLPHDKKISTLKSNGNCINCLTIKAKILLQRVWETKIGWDEAPSPKTPVSRPSQSEMKV
jgi:hypothetical protein